VKAKRSARSAIDGIAGLVSILAPNGEVKTANRQFLEYFGRSLEWIKNWGANDAAHPGESWRTLRISKSLCRFPGRRHNEPLRIATGC
jgi:hypothetical protein